MGLKIYILTIFTLLLTGFNSCAQEYDSSLKTGAENTNEYFQLLRNKNIGLVANQSSLLEGKHLVDVLLANNMKVLKIFSPEHGFRGKADAGEKILDGKDQKTGIPIVSLYGKNYKPSPAQVKGIDVMVFDLQDVGVRFYTYISTLHYVMEICAEQNIPLIVLDRPNPNAHYIDGPVLNMKYKSFVGMHPVPVVYGMTIGEYANMINGEGWLKNKVQCKLKVIPLQNWRRDDLYELPVKPSPNLPNALSVALYPSLCFFEGTVVSAGRGTDFPFQTFGHPLLKDGDFTYVPRSIPGASKYPKFKGKKCIAYNLQTIDLIKFRSKKQLDLTFLMSAYEQLHANTEFFNAFFKKLAGTNQLKEQLEAHYSEEQIRASWSEELDDFKKMRKKYLIYPEK